MKKIKPSQEEKTLLKTNKRELIRAGNFAFSMINQMLFDMVLDDVIHASCVTFGKEKRTVDQLSAQYDATVKESLDNLTYYFNNVVSKSDPDIDKAVRDEYVTSTVNLVEELVRHVLVKSLKQYKDSKKNGKKKK